MMQVRAVQGSTISPLPPATPAFDVAMLVVTGMVLAISSFTLTAAGLNYEEASGGPLSKLHPATVVSVLVLLAALLLGGLDRLVRLLCGHGAVVIYAAAALLLMGKAIVSGLPFTPVIDTFLGPCVVYLLLRDLPEGRGRRLALLIHVVMAVNAAIGLGEFLTGWRLTPIVVGGVAVEEETRSSALLGHPLANAAITACYVASLMLGGGRDLAPRLRTGAIVLGFVGMVTFGGRIATVSLIAFSGALALYRFAQILRGAPFRKNSVIAGLLTIPATAAAIFVLSELGFFKRFLDRFVDDQGSAVTRWDMLEMFSRFSWQDLLLGPDPQQVMTWRAIMGLDFGIESFEVAFVFDYGILATVGFFAALALFCVDICRSTQPRAGAVFVMFFIVASTSVSISAKTTLLSIIVLLVMILLRRVPVKPEVVAAPGFAPRGRRGSGAPTGYGVLRHG